MHLKRLMHVQDVFRAILYADLDFDRDPWPSISDEGVALVQSLLTRDPARRPTAAEALAHPWFDQLELPRDRSNNGTSHAPLLDSVVQRLQRFGTYGRLKQAALREIATAYLPLAGDHEMLQDIKSLFEQIDEDSDGRVPYESLVSLLKQGDFDLSETEVEILISQMDITSCGYVKCGSHIVGKADACAPALKGKHVAGCKRCT